MRRLIISIIIIFGFVASVDSAELSWDQYDDCCQECLCGNYIYIWVASVYSTICPADVLEDETNCTIDPNCVDHYIPSDCQSSLRSSVKSKVMVTPIGYNTTSFNWDYDNFPELDANRRYVAVAVKAERYENQDTESDFSNRIVIKSIGAVQMLTGLRIE